MFVYPYQVNGVDSAVDSADYYTKAFRENLGIVSEEEQERLRNACVAIPGVGGVGSSLLMLLARAGICRFRIADLGSYGIADTNRHYGATQYSIGQSRAEVMADFAASINPDARITLITEPISDYNIDAFLEGAHIVADGLDLFLTDTRCLLYRKARQRKLYVVLGAPLGFGAALQIFSPRGMAFEDFYDLELEMPVEDKITAFLTGLAPRPLYRHYTKRFPLDPDRRQLPVSGVACQLAASLAATEIINILIGRRPVRAVPYYLQIDPFRMQLKKGYLWRGNRNPLQRLRIKAARLRAARTFSGKVKALWR